MSDDEKNERNIENEVVKAMGDEVKPDVPMSLVHVGPDNVKALVKRAAGEMIQNECEFHCIACGWNKSLKFDPDEIEALDGNIRDYSGPCPGCSGMTLTPKDAFWGRDFPSMTQLAEKNKRAEARVQAEEFVEVIKENVGGMVGIPTPPSATSNSGGAPGGEDLPTEIDTSKLTPR